MVEHIKENRSSAISREAKIASLLLHAIILLIALWPGSSHSIPKAPEVVVSIESDVELPVEDTVSAAQQFVAETKYSQAFTNVTNVENAVFGMIIAVPSFTYHDNSISQQQEDMSSSDNNQENATQPDYSLPPIKPRVNKPIETNSVRLPAENPPVKPPAPVTDGNKPNSTSFSTTDITQIPFKPVPISQSSSPSLPRPVSDEERQSIVRQIHQNWSTDVAAKNYEQFQVIIRVWLRADGTVFNLQSQLDPSLAHDSYYRSFVRNAENAVWRTAKIIFPADRYEDFKEMELVFKP